MIENIDGVDRIGIEAEIHSYYLNADVRNKIVLAESVYTVKVGNKNIPYLKIVSEGANSFHRYMELVFAPLGSMDMKLVGRVIDIARFTITKVVVNSGKIKRVSSPRGCNVGGWVKCFNDNITKEKNYIGIKQFSLNPCCGELKLIRERGAANQAVIQANILTSISLLGNELFVYDKFSGIARLDEILKMYKSVCNKANTIKMDSIMKGIVFLTLYVVFQYSFNRYGLFSRNAKKYPFHILQKVELMSLLKELFDGNYVKKEEFISLMGIMKDTTDSAPSLMRDKMVFFKRNMTDLIEAINKNDYSRKITPRESGVLPIYKSFRDFYIVLEYRSNTLSELSHIKDKLHLER